MNLMDDLSRFDLSRQELLHTEMEQIQARGYDFMSAVVTGDIDRMERIFEIFVCLSETKRDIPTLQEYYGGVPISDFKDRISISAAIRYVVFVVDKVRNLVDWRVQPQPFS